jgi:signal transduction histidine kinase
METALQSALPIAKRRIRWPERLVWIMWAAACVVLFRKALVPAANNTLWVHIPYTLTFFGAGLVFINSAWRSEGKRRWTWSLLGLSNFASGIMALIGLGIREQILEYSKFGPIQFDFIILAYLLVFVGVAVYLPRRLSLMGNLASVTLDSIIVGLTTLLGLKILLPLLFSWPLTEEAAGTQIFIAFDMALLFAFCLVVIRYFRQDSNPLLILLCLATICQMLGDIFYMVFAWIPDSSFSMTDTVMPMYMLRSSLWALGAHWSIQYVPPKQRSQETKRLMPYSEWFAWTRTSRVCLLFVFGTIVLLREVPSGILVSLLVAAIFREVLSTHQEREVLHELQIANDQKQEAIEELGSVNRQLGAAHEQARSAASTMETFVARIIHDLAPPVQGLLSVVRDASWREDQHYLQHVVAGQVALLEAFVHQARAYIMARTVHLKRSKLDLLPICLSAVAAAQLRAEQRGVQIVQDILVESLTVVGDETAVRRILDNLLTNAVGISPPGGEVALTVTAPTPQQIEISVRDQGPGIPPEKQAQLFKPYTSLQFPSLEDHSRSRSPTGTGMGLGLAIVKELSLALGGDCGVTSTPNAGSTFYVRLPVEPTASLLVPEKEPA